MALLALGCFASACNVAALSLLQRFAPRPVLGRVLASQDAVNWSLRPAGVFGSGVLADRYPKRWVLAIGYSLAVIPATALLFAGSSQALYAVIFGVSGIYMGVWETVESATSAAMLPAGKRGLGFGVLATVNGLGDLLSSALVGSLWVFSPAFAMGFVIVSSVGGAAIIATTRPPDQFPSQTS